MALNIKKEFGNTRSRKPDLATLVYGKIPPQAPELEEAVLGAILLERDKQDEALSIIKSSECFYVDAHQKIYEAIIDLKREGKVVDLLTVTEQLRKNDNLEIVGGAWYVTGLTDKVASSAHVEAHARILMEKFIQRELIRVSGDIIGLAYEDSTDAFELLAKMDNAVSDISNNIIQSDVQHISKAAMDTATQIEQDMLRTEDIIGIPTGFKELDRITGGWQAGNNVVVAARPSVGKTGFVLNLAHHAASKGIPTAIFSLETKKYPLNRRIFSFVGGINMEYWKNPKVMPQEMKDKLFGEIVPAVRKLPIYIDDRSSINMLELSAKVRRLVKKHGVKLVIIDYLQLMAGNAEKGANREREVAKISRDIKVLAMDEGIIIIPLSQLNRAVENRTGKNKGVPTLADLRESGSIEQDADMVIFLYRPSEEDIAQDASLADVIYCETAKNRDGATEPIKLRFEKEFQRFSDYEEPTAWQQSGFTQAPNPRAGLPTTYPVSSQDVKDEFKPF